MKIPTSVLDAYKIDMENKNTLWRDAIKKDMKNVKVAFDILPNATSLPPGPLKLGTHLIYG